VQFQPGSAPTAWVSGLSSPKGLTIVGDTLYTADNTRVRGYRVSTGTAVLNLAVTGSAFLNDICSDGTYLYVSDTQVNRIYRIDMATGSQSAWATTGLNSPNGLWVDAANNRLIVVSFRSNSPIQAVNLSTAQVTTIVTTAYSDLDGITRDQLGYYYISSWGTNRVYRYNPDFSGTATVASTGHNGPADIFYNTLTDTLAVPNMDGNSISLVNLHRFGGITLPDSAHDFGPIYNDPADPWRMRIANSGPGMLTVYSVQTLALPQSFVVDTLDSLQILPGQTDTVTIRFVCRGIGLFSDSLRIESDDPVRPVRYVSVTGECVEIAVDPLESLLPSSFAVAAYPNPFNPSTTIRYDLPASGKIRVSVFDLLGREVATLFSGTQTAGSHEARFDGSQLSSGIYFVRLQTNQQQSQHKIVLLK
jgi:hypothetical protein